MSSECNHDCSSCSQDCPSKESLLFPLNPHSHIKRVIAVVSGKGGVGKSMVSTLLAVTAKRRGLKVGLLDADVTGPSIPKSLNIHEKAMGSSEGILPVRSKTGIAVMSVNLLLENDTDPVLWRGPVIAGAIKQFYTETLWGDLDLMVVDMPPGTGDVPLTVFQSLPLYGAVVVTSPQDLVSMVVKKAVNMARMMDVPVLGLVENMSYVECPDCGKPYQPFGDSDPEALANELQIPISAKIPISKKLSSGADKGMLELFDGPWLEALCDELFKGL